MKLEKIKFSIKQDKFQEFADMIRELATIDMVVLIKIENEQTLLYSILNENRVMIAMKSYLINSSDFFDLPDDFENLDIILKNAPMFSKQIDFIEEDNKIILDVEYFERNNLNFAGIIKITNNKYKINCEGGRPQAIKNIPIKTLEDFYSPETYKANGKNVWSVDVSGALLKRIKGQAKIDTLSKILSLDVINDKVLISDGDSWSYELSEVENITYLNQIRFYKHFLSNLDLKQDVIKLSVYPNFLMFKDDVSTLIISFENDFN